MTWTFTSTGAGNTTAIALGDGSTLAGSFTFDASANGGDGTYGQPSLALSNPAVFNGTTSPQAGSLTWYINDNGLGAASASDDFCCSDNQYVYLINANPATNSDLTHVAGYSNAAAGAGGGNDDAAYEIQLVLGTAMQDITPPLVGSTTVFIPIVGFDGNPADLNYGSGSQQGFCDPGAFAQECAQVNGSAGASFFGITGDSGSNQIGIWATVDALPPVTSGSGTPEPATFVMLGSGMLALGFARRYKKRVRV